MKKNANYAKIAAALLAAVVAAGVALAAGAERNQQYSIEYIIGLLCGVAFSFAFVALAVWLIRKKFNVSMNRYDERQKQAQGTAYMVGFYAFIIFEFIRGFLRAFFNVVIFDSISGEIVIILAAIVVWAGVCMAKSAYFSLDLKPKKFIVIYGAIGLINIAIGVMNLSGGISIIENGVFSDNCMNLVVGIFVMAILIMYGIISLVNNRREESE